MSEENVVIPTDTVEEPIWDNTEWFTEMDYVETPSLWTINAEYAEGYDCTNVEHKNTPILNQGNVGACSVFWITKAENEADYYDTKRVLDAMKIRNEGIKEWVIPDWWNHWWSMGWALNLMKNKWYISWWFFCNDIKSIWEALRKNNLCYTGTNQCSWPKTKQTWEFTPAWVGTGHLFAIVWINYDNEYLIAANSWWEWWGKLNGYFKIPFKHMKYLYSIVAIVDKKDKIITDEIAEDMKDANYMKELWIWNWQYPDDNLEKIHAVYMVMRAFWEDWYDNDWLLDEAIKYWIVTNVKAKLTRRHFLYMVWRAAYWATKYEYLIPGIFKKMWVIKNEEHLDAPITRYHAALIIARMLRNLWQID